ncbi:DUF5996 family protein [Streptomonospora litoralis]|uniref:Ava_C0101 and related proteins n=1 Tax=Streptomonospora litoralis TaxID=2498135 RepID=A0A4P6Q5X5_9ACTN|nr:DUF5996 family protein [Streptomonospora litoralis]QBI54419.1 hypothetical protein EKD16_13185 [Streptomonospora litoralis]
MTPSRSGTPAPDWPALPVGEWSATRDTLHMWTQILGKVRLAHAPMTNHWWQVPLYLSARGLTTSAVPVDGGLFDAEFDFCEHRLHLRSSDGRSREVALEPKPVAAFHAETADALRAIGVDPRITASPVEVEHAVPFAEDTEHASYDPDHAHRFWGQLVAAHRVLSRFRGRFIGKSSPVHFFWGAMDLAVTRFSGREAPPHPGGAPNCGDWVMVEAYSHELSSCGFWPGGSAEGSFYCYAYPEPAGFAEHSVGPQGAYYDRALGEFLLPYADVRRAPDPEAVLLEFLQGSYEAAAVNGGWDRPSLEDDPVRRASPR